MYSQMLFGFADTFVFRWYADQAVAAAGYGNQFLSIVRRWRILCFDGANIPQYGR